MTYLILIVMGKFTATDYEEHVIQGLDPLRLGSESSQQVSHLDQELLAKGKWNLE